MQMATATVTTSQVGTAGQYKMSSRQRSRALPFTAAAPALASKYSSASVSGQGHGPTSTTIPHSRATACSVPHTGRPRVPKAPKMTTSSQARWTVTTRMASEIAMHAFGSYGTARVALQQNVPSAISRDPPLRSPVSFPTRCPSASLSVPGFRKNGWCHHGF